MKLKKIKYKISGWFFFIYDFIFLIGFVIYLPVYAYRKKMTLSALKEKLALSHYTELKKSIWIHAVSVGEVHLIQPLIKKLVQIQGYSIVISTTTLTGNKLAKEKYASSARIIFLPLDISFLLKKIIRIISPQILIIVETEIWPNLFYILKKKNIPIVIINGRISDKAFPKYKKIKPIMQKIINKCDGIGAQTTLYKNRFIALGAKEDKVIVSGNMKFESIHPDKEHLRQIHEKFLPLLKTRNQLLIIAGSTHPGEEKIILEIYKEIILTHPNISLLIAPRHIERISELQEEIKTYGLIPSRISRLRQEDSFRNNTVFLLDIIGQLLYFYSISDICFVGGSLIKHGGQNILEPIYFQKPVIFGPYMHNFSDIEEIVLKEKAGIKIDNRRMLKETILKLLTDEKLRETIQKQCLKVFEQEKESVEKNYQLIMKCLCEKDHTIDHRL